MSGDLRRRLEFPDPLEQAQALSELVKELRQLIPKNGKLTTKNTGKLAEERLLKDCLQSEYPRVVNAACSALLALNSAGLIDTTLTRLHLLEALSNQRELDSIVAALAEVGESVEEQWKGLVTAINSNSATVPHVLSWMRERIRTKREDPRLFPLFVHMLGDGRGDRLFRILTLSLAAPPTRRFLQQLALWNPKTVGSHPILSAKLGEFRDEAREEECVVSLWEAVGEWDPEWPLPRHPSPLFGLQLSRSLARAPPHRLLPLLQLAENYVKATPSSLGKASLLSGLLSALSHVKIRGDSQPQAKETVDMLNRCLSGVEQGIEQLKGDRKFDVSKGGERSECALALESLVLYAHCEGLERDLIRTPSFEPTSLSVDTGILALLAAPSTTAQSFWLSFLVKCATLKPYLVGQILPVLLHRYAKESRPEYKELFLNAIPRLASYRFPTQKILKFLVALTGRQTMKGLELLLELFRRQEKIFPQIQDILVKDLTSTRSEVALVKLEFIQAVCRQSGDEFGEELVPVLSGVINAEKGEEGEKLVATSLAAISALCSQEVMDLESVWSMLGPKLSSDPRPLVKAELCRLLAHAADTELEDISEEFRLKAFSLLWKFATEHPEPVIQVAAITSIAKFDASYLLNSLLPPSPSENLGSEENGEEAEDEKVSGERLIEILNILVPSSQMTRAYGTFLNGQIRAEMVGYGRGMYRGDYQPRPVSSTKTDPLASSLSKLFLPDLHSWSPSTAVAALFSFEPKESFGKDAVFKQEKSYSMVFKILLSKCSPLSRSTGAMFNVLLGWKLFLSRFYSILIKVHQSAQGSNSDASSAAWLWARDRIGQLLTQALIENVNSAENATWCLALLILLTLKKEREGEGYKAALHSQYLSPDQWTVMALEALAQGPLPNYTLKARPLFPQQTGRITDRQGNYALLGLAYALRPSHPKIRPFLGTGLEEDLIKCLMLEKLSGKGKEERKTAIATSLGILARNSSDEADVDRIYDHLQAARSSSGRGEDQVSLGLLLAASSPASTNRLTRLETFVLPSNIDSVTKAQRALEEARAGCCVSKPQTATSLMDSSVKSQGDSESGNIIEDLSSRFAPIDIVDLAIVSHPVKQPAEEEKKYRATLQEQLKAEQPSPSASLAAAKFLLGTQLSKTVVDQGLPRNYSYLSQHSLLRASIKTLTTDPDNPFVAATILDGLLQKFEARDLPPLDWDAILSPQIESHVSTVNGVFLAAKVKSRRLLARFTSARRLESLDVDNVKCLLRRLATEHDGWDAGCLRIVLDKSLQILPVQDRFLIWELFTTFLTSPPKEPALLEEFQSFFWSYLSAAEIRTSFDTASELAGMEQPLRLLDAAEKDSRKKSLETTAPLKVLWIKCWETEGVTDSKELADFLGILQGSLRFSGLCLIFERLRNRGKGWGDVERRWIGDLIAESLRSVHSTGSTPSIEAANVAAEVLGAETSLFSVALCALTKFQLPFLIPTSTPTEWEGELIQLMHNSTPHLLHFIAQDPQWENIMGKLIDWFSQILLISWAPQSSANLARSSLRHLSQMKAYGRKNSDHQLDLLLLQ